MNGMKLLINDEPAIIDISAAVHCKDGNDTIHKTGDFFLVKTPELIHFNHTEKRADHTGSYINF